MNVSTRVASVKTAAVAHKGCKPAASSWRNGHQDKPHTKALRAKANTASMGRVVKS